MASNKNPQSRETGTIPPAPVCNCTGTPGTQMVLTDNGTKWTCPVCGRTIPVNEAQPPVCGP
jgi:predicted RNA-binding Zn-ribbon protein involved in translation (DUF1610 family)